MNTPTTLTVPRRSVRFADLARISSKIKLTAVELPELPDENDGSPGVIYFKSPTAGSLMRFMSAREKDAGKMGENAATTWATITIIAECAVDENGKSLFGDDRDAAVETIKELPVAIFMRLQEAVNNFGEEVTAKMAAAVPSPASGGAAGVAGGNASSETHGAGSPTVSLSS